MQKNKKILFIIYLNTHFISFIKLAKYLMHHNFEITFLFTDNFLNAYNNIDYQINLCRENKFKIIDENGFDLEYKKIKINNINKNIYNIIYQKLSKIWIIDILINPIIWFIFLRIKIINIQNLYKKIKPNIAIFAEENVVHLTSVYVQTANKMKILTILIPHTLASNNEMAESLYLNHEIKSISSKITAKLFPKWTKKYKNKKLLIGSLPQVLNMELFGLAPKNPWQFNSGYAKIFIVDSIAMQKFYLQNGIEKEKIKIIGSLEMTSANKQRLIKKHHLNDKPIILCAIPSYQARPTEFENFDRMINFLISTLNKNKKYQVIYNIHPNTEEIYKKKILKLGLNISQENISDIIACADIFVASVSATIRWAIALGIPVLNYDIYKYNYNDFSKAKGVITVDNKKEFEQQFKKITTDKKYYQELKEKQEKCAPDWGMLDGKSGERILKLIDKLIKK